jgi:hypothetical protein
MGGARHGAKGWDGISSNENVTHFTTFVARRGVRVTWDRQTSLLGECIFLWTFVVPCGIGWRWDMSLSDVSHRGKGSGKPRRVAFLSTRACLAVVGVTWATDGRWLGQIYGSLHSPVHGTSSLSDLVVAPTSPLVAMAGAKDENGSRSHAEKMCASAGGQCWCMT